MRKLLPLITTVLFLAATATAQYTNGRPRRVATLPGGACNERDFIQTEDTDIAYLCQNAAWALIGTGQATGTTSNPQFNTLGIGVAAPVTNAGSARYLLNGAVTDGINVKNSNTGASTVVTVQNDGNFTGNFKINGSATANTNFLTKTSTTMIQQNAAGGLLLLSSDASAPMMFGTGGLAFTNERMRINSAGNISFLSGGFFGWTSTGDSSGTVDTTISRQAAGVMQVGTTAANASGGIKLSSVILTNLTDSATAPTISSGFGTSPSVTTNNGTSAFTINVGTGGTATNGVIGLPTATNGWHCWGEDLTTQSTTVFMLKQIASSTTTATIANYNTAGAQAAWVASDIIQISCRAR